MLTIRLVVGMASAAMVIVGAGAASAQQDYPNKPIRFVTGAVGGSTDLATRLVAQGISIPLGQPVIVDNRGVGTAAEEIVAKALPDGYTVLVTGNSLWVGSLLRKLNFDPVRDFSPITLVTTQPNFLVVHPSLPVKTVKELIALAKASPGKFNYGSGGTGSTPHLTAELFKSMAGVNIVRIPYKGAAPALNAVIAGEVQLMFAGAAAVTPHLKSGKLRLLAVSSADPSALFPGLPTVAASGLPGFESTQINGMFAPAKTPVVIINRLNREVLRVLNTADVKERFFNAGVEALGSSPEQLAIAMKSEMARLGKVIKDADIRDE